MNTFTPPLATRNTLEPFSPSVRTTSPAA
jgi:hypothetical protein